MQLLKPFIWFWLWPFVLLAILFCALLFAGAFNWFVRRIFDPLMDLLFGRFKRTAYGFLVGVPLLSAFMALIGMMVKKIYSMV